MDIKYHFICSKKVDTRENLDDMFMKPIPRSKLIHCLDLLNIDYWKWTKLLVIKKILNQGGDCWLLDDRKTVDDNVGHLV